MKSEFIVKGFHCPSCEMLVKDVASDFAQIKSCKVDVKSGRVVVEHDAKFDITKFKKEIESLGEYKVIT